MSVIKKKRKYNRENSLTKELTSKKNHVLANKTASKPTFNRL